MEFLLIVVFNRESKYIEIIYFSFILRNFSRERNSPIQCRALFLTLIETILLFLFELLVCYNLELPNDSEYRLTWIVCFLPLIVLSIISVFTYVWLLRHGRSWEVNQINFFKNFIKYVLLFKDSSIVCC